MKQMIDQFADFDLFGRDNYEYYARVTGRVIRVQEEWICSFRYPVTPRESPDQPCCGGLFSIINVVIIEMIIIIVYRTISSRSRKDVVTVPM